MSNRFKLVFTIRFVGYMMFFAGLVSLAAFFAPIIQAELNYRFGVIKGISPKPIGFGDISAGAQPGEMVIPTSTDFGIVIEKINANAKVVADVNPASESEYTNALKLGVAHAKGTNYPGETGNIYLFSHSTDAPWNIIRYNAVFYLLRELQPGDKVLLFYQGRRYDYEVFDKNIVSASETNFLTNKYDKSVLSLQTCDPPGTLWKRLIVRAKLVGS